MKERLSASFYVGKHNRVSQFHRKANPVTRGILFTPRRLNSSGVSTTHLPRRIQIFMEQRQDSLLCDDVVSLPTTASASDTTCTIAFGRNASFSPHFAYVVQRLEQHLRRNHNRRLGHHQLPHLDRTMRERVEPSSCGFASRGVRIDDDGQEGIEKDEESDAHVRPIINGCDERFRGHFHGLRGSVTPSITPVMAVGKVLTCRRMIQR